MERLAPAGDVYQAGTLSGNPLATAAGISVLRRLRDPARLRAAGGGRARGSRPGWRRSAACSGSARWRRSSSPTRPIRNFEDAKASDTERYGALFRHLLERGIYVAPSQFECLFVSLAHSDEDIDRTVEADWRLLRRLTSGTTLAAEAAAESPLWGEALRAEPERDGGLRAAARRSGTRSGSRRSTRATSSTTAGRACSRRRTATTALLLGDYLYAHGLVRIAAHRRARRGRRPRRADLDLRSRSGPTARAGDGEAWVDAVRRLGGEPRARRRRAGARRARESRLPSSSRHVTAWLVANAAGGGRHASSSRMLVSAGLVYVLDDRDRRDSHAWLRHLPQALTRLASASTPEVCPTTSCRGTPISDRAPVPSASGARTTTSRCPPTRPSSRPCDGDRLGVDVVVAGRGSRALAGRGRGAASDTSPIPARRCTSIPSVHSFGTHRLMPTARSERSRGRRLDARHPLDALGRIGGLDLLVEVPAVEDRLGCLVLQGIVVVAGAARWLVERPWMTSMRQLARRPLLRARPHHVPRRVDQIASDVSTRRGVVRPIRTTRRARCSSDQRSVGPTSVPSR